MATFQNPAVNNTLPNHQAMTTAKDGAGWFSVRPPTGNPQEGQEGCAATVFCPEYLYPSLQTKKNSLSITKG